MELGMKEIIGIVLLVVCAVVFLKAHSTKKRCEAEAANGSKESK